MFPRRPLLQTTRRMSVLAAAAALALGACAGSEPSNDTAAAGVETSEESVDDDTSDDDTSDDDTGGLGAVGTLASDTVHEITIELDDAAYDAMLETYATTGEKDWIEATVTIDGTTFEQVGLRLKGNSSLRGLTGGGTGPTGETTTDDPASLPWLVKLDKYVEDQSFDGLTDLVIRSNSSETALNEAVALELLELAGLASQDAIATSLSVNGSDPVLRLVIEHPDDAWMTEWLDDSGALYKAESTGDYRYRGDDPEAYDEVFDQEAGEDNADLTPLIELLQFIEEADDETFAAELGERLDVEAFATYLAMQELIDNFDDIDGPGNNSYLYYDTETGTFTVVPWDHNLAFGTVPGGEGGPGGMPGGFGERPEAPTGGELPAIGDRPTFDPGDPGDAPGGGMDGRGGFAGANALVERFLAVDEWQALYEQRLAELRAELYESGTAQEVLDAWTAVVESSGLVDAAAVAEEAAAIATALQG